MWVCYIVFLDDITTLVITILNHQNININQTSKSMPPTSNERLITILVLFPTGSRLDPLWWLAKIMLTLNRIPTFNKLTFNKLTFNKLTCSGSRSWV